MTVLLLATKSIELLQEAIQKPPLSWYCSVGILIEYILSPECLRDIKNRDKKPRRSRGFLSRFFINRVNTRAKYVFYLNRYNKNRFQWICKSIQ